MNGLLINSNWAEVNSEEGVVVAKTEEGGGGGAVSNGGIISNDWGCCVSMQSRSSC